MDCNSGLTYCGQVVSPCLHLIFGFVFSLYIQSRLSIHAAGVGAYGFLCLLYMSGRIWDVSLYLCPVLAGQVGLNRESIAILLF